MISEATIDVVDFRLGTDLSRARKLSGLTKFGNVTLKWGMTFGGAALNLFKWHDEVWYQSSLDEFRVTPEGTILGTLASHCEFTLSRDQRDAAWMAQIEFVRPRLDGVDGDAFHC